MGLERFWPKFATEAEALTAPILAALQAAAENQPPG